MQQYVLRGVEVQFPYEAYPCQVSQLTSPVADLQTSCLTHTTVVQLAYMERVIQALQQARLSRLCSNVIG